MERFDRYFNTTSSIISGIFMAILGILLITLNSKLYYLIVDIFVFFFLITGLKNFITYFFKKGRKDIKSFRESLFNLLFALGLSFFPKIPYSILPIFFGCYFLLNSILQFIDLFILLKNQGNGKILKIGYILFYLILAFFLIFYPLKNLEPFLKLSGIYFILVGGRFILSGIISGIPSSYKNKMKRKIRISLPAIVECFIPYVVLKEINESLRIGNKKIVYEEKKNNQNPDLEVIVHVSLNGFNRMGHVDIHFDGEVIAYGNYDRKSVKCREIFGDGVIFTVKKEKYIPFCIEHSKKTLFVFGLKLSEKQKENVRKEIEKIKKDLVRWYPPLEELERNHQQEIEKCTDYSSCLYRSTKAKFYKVTRGNFKTFFVFGNNCCLLADRIIGKSGIDLLKMNGLITPGSYYEYLNREFMRKGSIVISRCIYNEKRKRNHYERKYFKSKKRN